MNKWVCFTTLKSRDWGKEVYLRLSIKKWAVVVAHLVERSLPIPEVRSLNPVIGKNLFILNICLLSTVYWKDENKKRPGMAHLKNGNGIPP